MTALAVVVLATLVLVAGLEVVIVTTRFIDIHRFASGDRTCEAFELAQILASLFEPLVLRWDALRRADV
jgi:hypothetical protein